MKRMISMALTLMLVLSLPVTAGAKSFSDTENHWAAAEIDRITEMELFNGISDEQFGPADNMTRAMFVTVLGRAAEKKMGKTLEVKEANPFVDVADFQYYTAYVRWAKESGIVNGRDDSHFAPNDPITRQDMCAIYVRFLNWAGFDLSAYEKSDAVFVDAGQISAYAEQPVRTAAAMGLITGVQTAEGMVFQPKTLAERAVVAVVTVRLMDQVEKLPVKPVEEIPAVPPVSGGAGGEAAGGGTKPPADAEIRQRLQKILEMYQGNKLTRECLDACTAHEQAIIADVMNVVGDALDSGMVLSKAAIRAAYPDEIKSVKARYLKLDDPARERIWAVFYSFDAEELGNVDALRDFFGI